MHCEGFPVGVCTTIMQHMLINGLVLMLTLEDQVLTLCILNFLSQVGLAFVHVNQQHDLQYLRKHTLSEGPSTR